MMNAISQLLVLFCSAILLASCGTDKAQQTTDEAIERHGGDSFNSFRLEFDFRGRHYTASRDGGIFRYTRSFTDSTGTILDVLANDGFTRHINGSAADLTDERRAAFTRSVNSVIYFALLPFGLNDDAVNKEWVRETTIRGKPYNEVRVTFEPQGGGDDHQDTFLYWFHRDEHTMDYFAYTYETDGGGSRFREAINARNVGGLRLQDYINYKPADESVPIDSLLPMFASGALEKLSVVDMQRAEVSPYRAPDELP